MFKKCFCILVVIFVIGTVWVFNSKSEFFAYSNQFEVYSYNASSNAVIETKCSDELPFLLNRYGTSCIVDEKITAEQILKDFDAVLLFTENTEEGISYYAYSSKLKYKANIKNTTVNLHIFEGATYVKVGSPIIFGSF